MLLVNLVTQVMPLHSPNQESLLTLENQESPGILNPETSRTITSIETLTNTVPRIGPSSPYGMIDLVVVNRPSVKRRRGQR